MRIRRGTVCTAAAKGSYTSKPRPAIVLQKDSLNIESVIVVLLTSEAGGTNVARVSIKPTAANGLRQQSYAMCDKIVAIPVSNIKESLGIVDNSVMSEIARSLADILGVTSEDLG